MEQLSTEAASGKTSGITGTLESPVENERVGGTFNIRGWACSASADVIAINVSIDGEPVKNGICEFPRYDVYRQYETEKSYLSGFMARVMVESLAPGEHRLEVTAVDAGEETVIGKIRFIKEKPANPFLRKFLGMKAKDATPHLGGAGPAMGVQSGVAGNLLKNFIRLGGLKPHHSVLDIGCGVGRMALPLTRYLTEEGGYIGTDNVKPSIDYATRHITPRYPHFRFHYTSVFNEVYNPEGRVHAAEYRFEFADDAFDFIFLTSVFTHMKTADVRNYLNEIARMLKPGGRCFITWFILNDVTTEQIRRGASKRSFRHRYDGFYSDFDTMPERAIAYEEPVLRKMYADAGLTVEEPVHLGKWSGLDGVSNQDIVIASK